MNLIENTIDRLSLGKETVFRNLVITPLLASANDKADYLMLDESLNSGTVSIKEVSNEGSVPDLLFENRGDIAVLLVDGEELVGAKQNRILNITVLVPAKTTITIPVSCVEAGRWAHESAEFHSEDRAFYAAGRARKAAHISDSLRTSSTRRSRQGEIWNDIADKSSRMEIHSHTEAMSDLYINHNNSLKEYISAFQYQEGQVGAAFSINGQVRGVEVFDFNESFRKLYKKLIGSYALDAIDEAALPSKPEGNSVHAFLDSIKNADFSTYPAVGEGEDIRISNKNISGGALMARKRIVHLCVFNTLRNDQQQQKNHDETLIRASSRRRFYQI